MFTEKILKKTDKPVVLADQKMTVPTERLIQALRVAKFLGLDFVNLTYLGAPYVDPVKSDFDLLKPRVLARDGIGRPSLSKDKVCQVGQLTTNGGTSLPCFYRELAAIRARDFRLSYAQIEWLLNPQEFDMTDFYLTVSGRSTPTRESIAQKYLPGYWQELGKAQIPVITDTNGLSDSCKRMIEEFGVQIVDLEDYKADLDYPMPSTGLSGSGYIDLSTVLDLKELDGMSGI